MLIVYVYVCLISLVGVRKIWTWFFRLRRNVFHLNLSFPVFPFDPLENRKPLIFCCFPLIFCRHTTNIWPVCCMTAGFLSNLTEVKCFPAGIYLLKVNNRKTRTRCEICSKLTIKRLERRQWLVVVNFEDISHLVLVFLLF